MDRLLQRGRPEQPHLGRLGCRALAQRQFERAAQYFNQGLAIRSDSKPLRYLHAYALCMASRLQEAAAAVRGARRQTTQSPSDERYWSWLTQTFGLPGVQ
ncbi:MAG: tetratricopeptide repeat protein [Planctomycetota bacterium]